MKKNNSSPLNNIKSLDNREYWEGRMVINQINKGIKKVAKAIKQKRHEIPKGENEKNAEEAETVKRLRDH